MKYSRKMFPALKWITKDEIINISPKIALEYNAEFVEFKGGETGLLFRNVLCPENLKVPVDNSENYIGSILTPMKGCESSILFLFVNW